MPADPGTGLQYIHPRVHVADADDLIHIHIIVTAYLCQLVGKSNVDCPVRILHDFCHLCRTDIRDYDLALTEGSVIFFYLFSDLPVINADRTVVVDQLIKHISRYDPLRSVCQVNIFFRQKRPYIFIDRSGRNGRFDHNDSPLHCDLQHFFHRGDNIGSIDFFGKFVVGCGHGDDIGICRLVLRRKTDTALHCCLEQFLQTIFLKCGMPSAQSADKLLIMIRPDNLDPVRRHHKRCRQTDIPQPDYIDHLVFSPCILWTFAFCHSFCMVLITALCGSVSLRSAQSVS